MSYYRQKQDAADTRRNVRVIPKVTTTDATPTTAFSIALGQQRPTYVQVRATVIQSDFSKAGGLEAVGAFRRASGGNVTRASGSGGLSLPLLRSINDFVGLSPSMNLTANTGTQSVDVVVTGLSGTTLNWHLEIISLQNLT